MPILDWLRQHWPEFESAPSQWTQIATCLLPFVAFDLIWHASSISVGYRLGGTVLGALLIRVSPWFKRPEFAHAFVLGGWLLGEIAGLFIWGHP